MIAEDTFSLQKRKLFKDITFTSRDGFLTQHMTLFIIILLSEYLTFDCFLLMCESSDKGQKNVTADEPYVLPF